MQNNQGKLFIENGVDWAQKRKGNIDVLDNLCIISDICIFFLDIISTSLAIPSMGF